MRTIETAQIKMGTPLSPLELDAAHCVERLALSPEFRLDLTLERGDMQFLNNLVTLHARTALETGDLATLGALLSSSHDLLRQLGVSTPRMDALRAVLLEKGALGAKLTGAGGGGLVLGLFPCDPSEHLDDLRARGEVFTTYIRG